MTSGHSSQSQSELSTAGFSRRELLLGLSGIGLLTTAAFWGERLQRQLVNPAALAHAAERLSKIPERIGDWSSTTRELPAHEARLAEVTAGFRNDYRRSRSNDVVTLTVLCGPAGPLSVHPPEACLEGLGWQLSLGPVIVSPVAGTRLHKAAFEPPEFSGTSTLRVVWGWSTGGAWDVPDYPRLAYRGQAALFKLYAVSRDLRGGRDSELAESFLADALPVISEALQS
jgi:hypothetical protein